MAKKGDRAYLEPQAIRLYAQGLSLSSISEQLDVSVTSLSRWKEESKVPSATMDEWDRSRNQKRSNRQRLQDLYEEQLLYVEGLHASKRTGSIFDSLSKMGALIERMDKMEKAQRVAEEVVTEVKKAGLTAATANDIRTRILGIGQ